MRIEIIACVIALCYSLLYARNKPLSLLYKHFHSYKEMLQIVETNNEERVSSAKRYINSLEPLSSSRLPSEFDLVVVIVTVSRQTSQSAKDAGYLLQTAASMHRAVQGDGLFQHKLLFICNVDGSPSEHVDATLLKNGMHFLEKTTADNNMGINPPFIPTLQNCGLHDEIRKREIIDYAYCLNASLELKPKHVLVLEDDVLPMPNLFPSLNMFLTRTRSTTTRMTGNDAWEYENGGTSEANFSFLKLYYPLRWQGFAFEGDRMLELICLGLCVGGICLCLRWFIYQIRDLAVGLRRKRFQQNATKFASSVVTTRKWTNHRTSMPICELYMYLIYSSTAVLFALVVGRVNIFDIRHLHTQLTRLSSSSACCTQAMLYPASAIPVIINHLLVNNSLNKDLSIYDFSASKGPQAYQLEPNMFVHTGMYTSLSATVKGFEEFVADMSI